MDNIYIMRDRERDVDMDRGNLWHMVALEKREVLQWLTGGTTSQRLVVI